MRNALFSARMRRPGASRRRMIAGVLAFGLVWAGCGGSSSKTSSDVVSSTAASTPTQAASTPTQAGSPSSKASSIEACLRSQGLKPKPATVAGGYTRIDVPLANGNGSVIFVFASSQQAAQRAGDFTAYLGASGGQATRHGQTIVAYSKRQPPPEAKQIESCT
jgi:hypothetical protein